MTVRKLQLLLTALGYDPGGADGIPGKRTEGAVREFQREYGLEADGIAGKATEAALRKAVFESWERPDACPEPGAGWWKDIRYFTRSEPFIACSCGRCGGFPVEPSEKLMRLADKVRAAAGSPMIPSSTLRCPAHNRAVGGVANSRHLTGKAMDFSIRGWPSAKTLTLVKSMPETAYAYAIDEGHVHMDVV